MVLAIAFLLLVLLCPIFSSRVIAADRVPAKSALPNIVLVMADDQGWGDMAYNGHPVLKTPHFDAMARESLRLDCFHAAAPVCSPTRGAVLTGRHPNRFACFSWGHALRPQELTIAEALREAGYTTGHFGKWHLGSVRRGSPASPGASGFDRWVSAPNFFENDAILCDEGKAVQSRGESSEVVVDLSLDFIRHSQASGKPFLAVVWFGSPHAPHVAVPEDLAAFPDQPRAKQNFYGEITAMDRAFGKLRSGLDELGIRDNTILWYTSDNGALPQVGSSGGFRGKKGAIYEGGLLVPAMIEWPAKIAAPRHDDTPLNSTDIFPTLLEIAGVPVPDARPRDGVSILPLIEGADLPSRSMGFWSYPVRGMSTPSAQWMAELLAAQQSDSPLPEDPVRLRMDAGEVHKIDEEKGFPGHAAWLEGDWKLHRIQSENQLEPRFELYNLALDPDESDDLAGQESARVTDLRQRLEAWLVSVLASANGTDY